MKTKKFREARRKAMMGENNPRWNGGNSEYPNHAEFKRARIVVLKNTKGKCEVCGEPAKMVHHIDGDKGNHSIDNLIALCWGCHEPLHNDDNGRSIKGRPTKYGSIYGMPLREIANIFGVVPSTIHCWNKDPEKREWLEKKLKYETKEVK